MPSAATMPREDDRQQQHHDLMTDTNDANCSKQLRAADNLTSHLDEVREDNDLLVEVGSDDDHNPVPQINRNNNNNNNNDDDDDDGTLEPCEQPVPPVSEAANLTSENAAGLHAPETTVPKSIANSSDQSSDTDNNNNNNRSQGRIADSDHRLIGSYLNNSNRYYRTAASSSPLKIVSKLNNIVTRISKVFANSSLVSSTVISTIQQRSQRQQEQREDHERFAFGQRRTLEKIWKLMDKVVKCCQNPLMKLNNSPPFILDILPETYKHLKLIHTKYTSAATASTTTVINDNDYSRVFLKNLQNRCEQILKLFKDAREEIYQEDSECRHKLTRNTLVFNHMLCELKAIFPAGAYIGDKYLITKKESAGEFWRNSFGQDTVLVSWKTFYHALQQVHSIDSSFFSLNALKQTIDLTGDDHISIFEFDVFTRLFQPWSSLLKNWQTLAVTHPGYKAFLTYDELKARLAKHINKPGSYVFRLSCTRLGQWAIGYVTEDGQILQTIVQNISLSQALTETEFYVYPDGREEEPELRERLRSGMTMGDDERNVIVTEEQYEIYCGIGNSFQTCKICFVNDKEIRVEPCNHLLCTSCLLAWQESEGQGCPYCRTEIKETVQITMDLRAASATKQLPSSTASAQSTK